MLFLFSETLIGFVIFRDPILYVFINWLRLVVWILLFICVCTFWVSDVCEDSGTYCDGVPVVALDVGVWLISEMLAESFCDVPTVVNWLVLNELDVDALFDVDILIEFELLTLFELDALVFIELEFDYDEPDWLVVLEPTDGVFIESLILSDADVLAESDSLVLTEPLCDVLKLFESLSLVDSDALSYVDILAES